MARLKKRGNQVTHVTSSRAMPRTGKARGSGSGSKSGPVTTNKQPGKPAMCCNMVLSLTGECPNGPHN